MGDDFKDPCIVGEDQGADEQSRNEEPADKDANSSETRVAVNTKDKKVLLSFFWFNI